MEQAHCRGGAPNDTSPGMPSPPQKGGHQMDYNQNTNPTGQQQFLLPAMTMDSDFTAEELAEDMDGMQMNFPRVKIPSGGSLQFEIPTGDPDNPDYAKTLTGIILFNHPNNAYWPEGDANDDNATPLCSSTDGKLGVGTPGGSCAVCAMNQFGSAAERRGKACKNMRVLYLLRSGELVPLQLSLPPTSLKPFRQFIGQAFSLRRRDIWQPGGDRPEEDEQRQG